MWKTGRVFQIAAEMTRYNLELLGISETHWTQVGQQRLPSGELLLYSDHEEENAPHIQQVTVTLSKQAQNTLVGWESHELRIIEAPFKTKKEGISTNVIQWYAPTNDYKEDAKDRFYNRLQSIVEKCPTKVLNILMGDQNAKVGKDNAGYEDIMGRHGVGERNENGDKFANLYAFNKLVIGGTIFPHKRIHKITWTSPDHTTQNHIDNICINKKFRRTMEDVRTKRGVDIASDHHLLVAKMKAKLKKYWTMERTISQKFNTAFLLDTDKLNKLNVALSNRFQDFHDLLNIEAASTNILINIGPPTIEGISIAIRQIKMDNGETTLHRFNVAFLRDTIKINEFKITLNNRFQTLQDLLKEETTMNHNYKRIEESPNSTSQEVLGSNKHHHKEWISIETLDKIQE
ncbi:unnamed protein product [Schistosoma margrebowiei]|uniref:Uncharacterized protein n=1 Tax=Schistosoma margrebowiei TaxID=48269 RepID=A0A183LEQ5_9TREM|nr:unnamed protein product [Schistosoma margrebowiei]